MPGREARWSISTLSYPGSMGIVIPFHSASGKGLPKRAHAHYHRESECQFGKRIKLRGYDLPGTGGYRLCKRCSVISLRREAERTALGRISPRR